MKRFFLIKKTKGFTLAELLVATFVFLLCTTAVVSSWLMVQKMYKVEIGTIDTRRELRLALHRMNSDFKLAQMIYFNASFNYGVDPNGTPITHTVPGPGETDLAMAVAIPEMDSEGLLSGDYTIVAYVIEAMEPPDDLNPDAYQLVRFARSHVPGPPESVVLQTSLINHTDTVKTVLAKYIQNRDADGLEFSVFPNSRGIRTAAIRVQRNLANAPAVQQQITSGYYMRNH